MKKGGEFKVGDKVFAKVKGYPPWPATIVEEQKLKYNVKFFGTGETGIVKPKDLFYYLKHKNKFIKTLKRKDYNDAIEEIEREIKASGTDGNTEEADTDKSIDTTISSNSSTMDNSEGMTKIGKRKRSSPVPTDIPPRKKATRSKTPVSSTDLDEKNEESLSETTEQPSITIDNGVASNGEIVKDETDVDLSTKSIFTDNEEAKETDAEEGEEETLQSNEKQNKERQLTVDDIKIITDDYLQAIVAYAEHARKDKVSFQQKLIEPRKYSKNEVLMAKLPTGRYVGIKYNQEVPSNISNEFDYAEYDESEAKTLLSLKTLIEQGSCQPDDEPHLFITNLDISEFQLNNAIEVELIERKKAKLRWLKTESSLIELDAQIKGYLGLDKAEPKSALEDLDKMLQLDVHPLMLKKHPNVVDMVKRLRRYIGNVKKWNLKDEEATEFEKDAKCVREKAHNVYLKFSKLFRVQDEMLFWDIFTAEVEQFKIQITDMPENEVYALSSEPNSRQAFLNRIDEEDEMKIILAKLEKNAKSMHKKESSANKVVITKSTGMKNETVSPP